MTGVDGREADKGREGQEGSSGILRWGAMTVSASVTDSGISRGGRGVAEADAPAASRISSAVWANALISGKAALCDSC